MKYFFNFIFLLFSIKTVAQSELPNIYLKDLQGKNLNIAHYNQAEQPVIISFWATWCGPCIKELRAIHKHYTQWKKELGITFLAISIDDAKTKNRVKSLAKSANWEYTVLFDDNHELKRSLNVSNVPHTIILHKGKIVYTHAGYTPGIETELYKTLQSL